MADISDEIVFWTLRQKFVDSGTAMPEKSSQVMCYSLAIGHHVGVIDCLRVALRCPLAEYHQWIASLEDEQARRKMQGVVTFGEIIIDSTHISLLAKAFTPLTKNAESPWKRLSDQMMKLLDDIAHEPAIYLLARKITGSGIR